MFCCQHESGSGYAIGIVETNTSSAILVLRRTMVHAKCLQACFDTICVVIGSSVQSVVYQVGPVGRSLWVSPPFDIKLGQLYDFGQKPTISHQFQYLLQCNF